MTGANTKGSSSGTPMCVAVGLPHTIERRSNGSALPAVHGQRFQRPDLVRGPAQYDLI